MIIHINSNIIKSNSKHDKNDAPISIRKTKSAKVLYRCHELLINVPIKIVYDKINPLPCGAKVWIETRSKCIVEETTTNKGNTGRILHEFNLILD
jgi:hypothetical protein